MAGVLMKLGDHLTTVGLLPFEYGKADCCTFACDWIYTTRGVDPMASWRGQYTTLAGARRRMLKDGGMVNCISNEMRSAGLLETKNPQPGDVGLVRQGNTTVLAIKTALGWACKAERGFAVAPLEMIVAWRV